MDIKRDVKFACNKLAIKKLRKHQQKPINAILNEQDTLSIAPTSAGKSAIYQIPAILHPDKPTLVVEPTLSLLHDQVQKLKSQGISVEYIDSTLTKSEQQKILTSFAKGNLNILYLTPERLQSESFLCALSHIRLFMLVVDECHCVLYLGYSFRESYLLIGKFVDSLSYRPVIAAFTATASEYDIEQICKLLSMKDTAIFINDLYRKNLTFIKKYAADRSVKQRLLMKYLRKYHNNSTVIYCNTKIAVDAVYEFLQKKFPGEVVKCHSAMSAKKRTEHELEFLTGEKTIMVATSAFGMGIDLDALDLVVHFNMPLSIIDYMQQAGRAGRNGQRAHCILLYDDTDYFVSQGILSDVPDETAQKRALMRLDEIKDYCDDNDNCMAQMLLSSFGQKSKKPCNHCTNCQKSRRS